MKTPLVDPAGEEVSPFFECVDVVKIEGDGMLGTLTLELKAIRRAQLISFFHRMAQQLKLGLK